MLLWNLVGEKHELIFGEIIARNELFRKPVNALRIQLK